MTKYIVEVRRYTSISGTLTVEIEFDTKEAADAYLKSAYNDYVLGREETVDYEETIVDEATFQKEILIRMKDAKGKKIRSLLLTTSIREF